MNNKNEKITSVIEKYVEFSKIQLTNNKQKKEETEDKEKQEDQPPNENIFVFPLSGRIITQAEYEKLTKIETGNEKCNIINKKRLSNEMAKKSLSNKPPQNNSIKIYSTWSDEKINSEIKKLKEEISNKEKENNSSYEKEKIEIEKYSALALKWKKIAQESIYKLIECYPQDSQYNPNTVKTVLNSLNIDKSLLDYDSENDCFNDE